MFTEIGYNEDSVVCEGNVLYILYWNRKLAYSNVIQFVTICGTSAWPNFTISCMNKKLPSEDYATTVLMKILNT